MTENLHSKFQDHIKTHHLFQKDDLIIVAISGGIDSVVLTHLLLQYGQPMVLAHCNFNLRGGESQRDEQFVRTLAAQWELELHVETYHTEQYAHENKLSIQVAARRLRYDFFERLRTKHCQAGRRTFIATAHHANDSVETILINLFRGTGINGLTGIPVQNGYIIRPLLFCTRAQVENYAEVSKLSWVEDSSNEKENYTRNFIRHNILPAAQSQFPSVMENIIGTAKKLEQAAGLYQEMVRLKLGKLVEQNKPATQIPIRKLRKETEYATLIWEWIKPYGFTEGQVGEVVKLMNAETGARVQSATHRILRNRDWLVLSPLADANQQLVVLDSLPARQGFGDNQLLTISAIEDFDPSVGIPQLPANEALIDARDIRLPLILRPWKPGDYFYPLGMPKKKKLARFLIDKKLSVNEKEKVWVLESHQRIIWVVGHRIDDRNKITNSTSKVIRLSVV